LYLYIRKKKNKKNYKYKGYELSKKANEWGYFEAVPDDRDGLMMFNRSYSGLKEDIDDITKEIRRIVTSHDNPPIPIREFDWSASRDDYDEGDLIGYGKTEEDAIQDLLSLED